MEMEAVIQEQASLENQLASMSTQISNLTSEVEEQKSTVSQITILILSLSLKQELRPQISKV